MEKLYYVEECTISVSVVLSRQAKFLRSGHNCEVERKEKSRRLFETDLRIYERQHRLPVTLGAGRDLRFLLRGKEGCLEIAVRI